MDVLWLTPEQAREIGSYALEAAPHEACGIIGGTGRQAQRIIPTANVATNPTEYYEIDPRALVAAMMQLRTANLDLIGFYHSHPQGAPVPSRSDIALATYPDMAYLIVGLNSGEPELAAWRLKHGDADSLPLHIANEPPPYDSGTLSRAQIAAILLSAILAVAAFLAISVSLLPPAPRIP